MEHFASTLKVNSALLSLRLTQCGIEDEGFAILAEAVAMNSTLQDLSIFGNDAKQLAMEKMTSMMRRNTSLVQLDLSIAPELRSSLTVRRFFEAAAQHPTLTDVDWDWDSRYERWRAEQKIQAEDENFQTSDC